MKNQAFVLLPQAQLPKSEDIARAFERFATDKDQRLRVRETTGDPESKAERLEVELSPTGTGFVHLMPVAVPEGEADHAARFSVSSLKTGWKLPPHNAQLVVKLRDTDPASPMENLSRFTSLLAAVTEASGAVGVYWGNAGATHDSKFFMSVAQQRKVSSRLMLWTGVSVARDGDGRLSLLSTGMKQLDLPDLLLVASRSAGGPEALAAFFDLLGYVAKGAKPVSDGDTVGRTAVERWPVHYVPSPVDPKVKVWRVDMN